jgi:hypothetical protein
LCHRPADKLSELLISILKSDEEAVTQYLSQGDGLEVEHIQEHLFMAAVCFAYNRKIDAFKHIAMAAALSTAEGTPCDVREIIATVVAIRGYDRIRDGLRARSMRLPWIRGKTIWHDALRRISDLRTTRDTRIAMREWISSCDAHQGDPSIQDSVVIELVEQLDRRAVARCVVSAIRSGIAFENPFRYSCLIAWAAISEADYAVTAFALLFSTCPEFFDISNTLEHAIDPSCVPVDGYEFEQAVCNKDVSTLIASRIQSFDDVDPGAQSENALIFRYVEEWAEAYLRHTIALCLVAQEATLIGIFTGAQSDNKRIAKELAYRWLYSTLVTQRDVRNARTIRELGGF